MSPQNMLFIIFGEESSLYIAPPANARFWLNVQFVPPSLSVGVNVYVPVRVPVKGGRRARRSVSVRPGNQQRRDGQGRQRPSYRDCMDWIVVAHYFFMLRRLTLFSRHFFARFVPGSIVVIFQGFVDGTGRMQVTKMVNPLPYHVKILYVYLSFSTPPS